MAVTLRKRFLVLQRDNYRCQLCGKDAASGARLEVDHKIPVSKGGSDESFNLWVLCYECNRGKFNKFISPDTEATLSVTFSPSARNYLNSMALHLLQKTDKNFTKKTMFQLMGEIKEIRDHSELDVKDSRLKGTNMRWYWLLDSRFQVFYERRPSGIRVVKLWPARREPIDPGSI